MVIYVLLGSLQPGIGDARLQRAGYISDRPALCGWASSWTKERGEVWMVSLAWQGGTGIISAAGAWLLPAPRCSVGALPAGGNAVWFPRLLLRLLALTPFPSVHSFIIYCFLLLFSSLAGSRCVWLRKGVSYGAPEGSGKTPLSCCSASPLRREDRSVWHAP